jgi:hypothetical protein
MWLTDRIFSLVWDISDYFYRAYQEASDWIWPFSYIQYPFYSLYRAFWSLLWPIADLGDWLGDLDDRIADVMDRAGVLSLLRTWINYAEAAWDWISDSWRNVTSIVASWWSGTSSMVLAWIDQVRDYARVLVDQVRASLGDLRSSWDNFWTISWPTMLSDLGGLRSSWESFLSSTLPNLATWTGSQALIETTIRTFFPFYDELVQFWSGIREFFSDPEAYLVRKLETMLERFW